MKGCDFTTSFYRKGKIKPFEVLQNDHQGIHIKFFQSLLSMNEPDYKQAEEFICALYGIKGGIKEVNEARYAQLHHMTGKFNQVTMSKNIFDVLNNYNVFILNVQVT